MALLPAKLDLALLRTLRTRWHEPAFERAVVRFSRLGEHSRLWFTAGALGLTLHRGRRGIYARLLPTLAATEVANAVAKLVIGRPRPQMPDLPPLMGARSGRSCPSAHAATSFAAARLLSQALPAAPVYLVAGAMALSRPYVGVHYPSDLVAGLLLGMVLAEIALTGAKNHDETFDEIGSRRPRHRDLRTASHGG
jgi:Membrane-associated phospholipid phosphatase